MPGGWFSKLKGKKWDPFSTGGYPKGPQEILKYEDGTGGMGLSQNGGVPWGPFEICRYENGTGDMRVLTRDPIRKLLRTGHLMLPQRAWGVLK